jgi:hypothetical protein
MIRVLILLPCTGNVIAPFCRTFPLGFESGIRAAIKKFRAFGEEPDSVHIDIVDLARNASPNDEMPVRPLIDAAERACNHFSMEDYDVLVSGTSPISSHLLERVEAVSRFKGVHFLVSFDKDIVRWHPENCVRLLPHYGLEFPLYIQEIKRVLPRRCVIAHVDDEHTTTSSYRFFKDIQKACTESLGSQIEIVSLPIRWNEPTSPERNRRIIETIKGCNFLIVSTYFEQLKKISQLCEEINEQHFPKEVLINLDGVDLLGEEVGIVKGLLRNRNARVIAPECVLGKLHFPATFCYSDRVKVNWYDANFKILVTSPVQDFKFSSNYVAAYAFDSATAIIYGKQSKVSEGAGLRLTKPVLTAVLPFRGHTGQIALDISGDLRVPLRLAQIQQISTSSQQPTFRDVRTPPGNKIAPTAEVIDFVPIISNTSTASASLNSSSGTFSQRIREMLGLLSFSTRYLCFLDVTYQDLHQSDKDLSWVVAAPTYSGIDAYKKRIIECFGDKSHGYRIGNHPVVKALLPQVTSVSSVSEDDLAVLPNGMPVFRIPETDAELATLFAFVRSNQHDSIWQIELVDSLQAELRRATNESEPFETEHPALAFSAEETKFSKLAQSEIGSEEPPPLSQLWKEFSEQATKARDDEKRLRSNAGIDLRKLYMVPVYLKPHGDQSNFNYAQSVKDLDRFRIAQIYLGIGWSDNSERIEAEREATLVIENIRSWLLEQSSKERIAKFERRAGAAVVQTAFGHQVKGLGQFYRYWLVPGYGSESEGSETTYVPALFEDLGKTLTYWGFGTQADDFCVSEEEFPTDLFCFVELAAAFANHKERAVYFARKNMKETSAFNVCKSFVPITLAFDGKNTVQLKKECFYPTVSELANTSWREFAGLCRYLSVLMENAFEYRPDGCTNQTVRVSSQITPTGRCSIVLTNFCIPKCERENIDQEKRKKWSGARGGEILKFIAESSFSSLGNFEVKEHDKNTEFSKIVAFDSPAWMNARNEVDK